MKVSIITVNLNNKKGLETTVKSVAEQIFRDYEHIIIDGGSTDGSIALIEQNAHLFSYWVSEKDTGIYNAMNKGINKAVGDYCFFLNSGDWMVNERVLTDIEVYLAEGADIIYGNDVKINPVTREESEWKYPANLTFNHFYLQTIPHQTSFIKTIILKELGMYNEGYKIVSDWAFFTLAICKFGKTFKYIDIPISYFVLDGIGSDRANLELIMSERKHFLEHNFNAFIADYQEYNAIRRLQVLKYWKSFKKTYAYKIVKKIF